MNSSANGHADCARLLLDAGADKNAKNKVRVTSAVCGQDLLHWGRGDE